MKRNLTRLSQRYVIALRKHLQQGRRASLQTAHGLGREAAALRLQTLDLARVHEAALATMEASSSRNGIIKRARAFFAEVITPIERANGESLRARARLNHVSKTLDQRTKELAVSNRSLKQGIADRKTVEKALKKSGEESQKLLEESHRLQDHLRNLTRQILTAQEDKRKKMSRDLQDEIAQTLLGINVRLLTLKKEAAANARGFKKDIASTQKLVDKAGKSINRFGREISQKKRA